MTFSLSLDSETLKSYEAYLSLQKNRSPHTVRAYMQMLGALAKFAEVCSKTDAVSVIRDFIKDAAPNCAKTTQAQRASALRSFIQWSGGLSPAEKLQLIKHVQSPKIPKRVPRILDLADIQKILDYIQTQSLTEQTLFYLLYGSGLRISEALGAEWRNLNLNEPSLKILGKGAKERIVPIVPALVRLLKTETPNIGDLILDPPPHETLVRKWVRRWGADLELEEKTGRWHPHKLRHSIASHLLQMGGKVPQIQKFLGHEQLATTEKYTHLNPSNLLSIYKKAMPLS